MIDDGPAPPSIGVAPPEAVSARIRAAVTENLRPDRGPTALQRWLLGLGAVLATLTGVVVVLDGRGHAPEAARTLGSVSVGTAMVAAATFISLARAGSATVSFSARAAIAALPPIAFLVVAWLTTSIVPAGHVDHEGGSHLGCFMDGALMAALPMIALLVLWRRTDPFTPRLTGALIGGWAGLSGAVGLSLACPSSDAVHLALGHGGAIVGGALIGLGLGRRLLSP